MSVTSQYSKGICGELSERAEFIESTTALHEAIVRGRVEKKNKNGSHQLNHFRDHSETPALS